MIGGTVPTRVPASVPAPQQQWMKRTNVQLEQMGRLQGVGISGGTLPTEVPVTPQFITGKIRAEGSGSGSGSFSLNPAGVGFTDTEGYLAYAFDQTYSDSPWKGTLVPSGISTQLPAVPADVGTDYAYPLNSSIWREGAGVVLMRAGLHWIIVGSDDDDTTGSGSPIHLTVNCGGSGSGSSTTYTITGNDRDGWRAEAV